MNIMMSYKTNLKVKKKIGRLGRSELHYLKRSLKLKQSLKPILNKKIVKNY